MEFRLGMCTRWRGSRMVRFIHKIARAVPLVVRVWRDPTRICSLVLRCLWARSLVFKTLCRQGVVFYLGNIRRVRFYEP